MFHGLLRLMLFVCSQALDSQHCILWAAVSFFLDHELLLPKSGIEGVALLDSGIAESLSVIHAIAIRKLLEQVLDLPLDVRRRFFGAPAKVHVVLNLQPAQLIFEQVKFFVNRQSGRSI